MKAYCNRSRLTKIFFQIVEDYSNESKPQIDFEEMIIDKNNKEGRKTPKRDISLAFMQVLILKTEGGINVDQLQPYGTINIQLV